MSMLADGVGFGLRPGHFLDIFDQKPDAAFLEAHSENYFGGSPLRRKLLKAREDYQISLHGVGLSLGRADGLDQQHLADLKRLVDDVDPLFVSEHLSWSAYSHIAVPDLLPLPRTQESFNVFCQHVDDMQNFLGRQVLIENPSNYLAFQEVCIPEPDFLNDLAQKTGCGLLLDINNIYVSAYNLGFDPVKYVHSIDVRHVQEFHLAGYEEAEMVNGDTVYIDTHGEAIHAPVWDLYRVALARFGDVLTLLEWDTNLPELEVLLEEVQKVRDIKQGCLSGLQKVAM
ncbi:MAG: DUF692 domain-containing protein [Alphaproteobacteria bacterium]|nr:DUF692 domain-containing protein [Alphaproteobacteria bacterium]MDD9920650.1 DUF692 domain-containing protein [Alphaproteobacteria bacterium]